MGEGRADVRVGGKAGQLVLGEDAPARPEEMDVVPAQGSQIPQVAASGGAEAGYEYGSRGRVQTL